ncbi:MAG: FHA domain-containing protein [Anaerolineae bacterium]|nr:FHA domain-containing protein [Anaerolineae bacterium]
MSTDTPANQQADSPDTPKPATEDERVLAEAGRAAETSQVSLTCSTCGLVNRPGELACARCGTILVTGGTTRKLGANDETPKPTQWPTGDVIVADQEPIILEIDGQQVQVPVAEVITIGRISDIRDDARPDVDLSTFGAGDKGVSRKHIKIKRKNILVYVADLGSTNGTLLNGRRLIPNAERLLRNGDELQLGRLKLKVKF